MSAPAPQPGSGQGSASQENDDEESEEEEVDGVLEAPSVDSEEWREAARINGRCLKYPHPLPLPRFLHRRLPGWQSLAPHLAEVLERTYCSGMSTCHMHIGIDLTAIFPGVSVAIVMVAVMAWRR